MSDRRSPAGFVELIRLLVVVACAGIGYEIAAAVSDDGGNLLGPFNGVAIGVLVGSGIGYVIGGVLGRTTITTVDRTETALREVSAEALVASLIGLVGGVLAGVGLGLPFFLIPEPYVAFPLFTITLAMLGYAGLRLGQSKRDGVLQLFGARAGLAPRVATSVLPRIVDTSVAVDGRILDVVRAGFLHGAFVVTAPVLGELQALADAADDVRRARGRRGLETLESLRHEPGVEIEVWDDAVPDVPEVDAKLIRLCLDRDVALLTLDTNLAKSAALAGVRVLNLHALTLAVRPAVQAGDEISVLLIKAGKEQGQAVGYLDDGTMVVAERLRSRVGDEVPVRVTSVLTTANGRMVFAQPVDGSGDRTRRPART